MVVFISQKPAILAEFVSDLGTRDTFLLVLLTCVEIKSIGQFPAGFVSHMTHVLQNVDVGLGFFLHFFMTLQSNCKIKDYLRS